MIVPGSDQSFMALALEQARQAAQMDEVPVGAVVVQNGLVIGVGSNSCIAHADPTAHAETNALRQAAQHVDNYRLEDCTLYVTLEPCAMCAGAILNARLKRLVFGAYEPKTGAGGSALNLFAISSLNHQTAVEGGVLASECRELLQDFFENKRKEARAKVVRLREDALRTPDSCFESLSGYPWQPRYVQSIPTLAGLRMHYLDEGPANAPMVFLCLHAYTSWSYIFKDQIPVWVQGGSRVLAPDLIGFGKSDKPKRYDTHSLDFHASYLRDWIDSLNLQNITLVVQEGAEILARMLPVDNSSRYRDFLTLQSTLNQRQSAEDMRAHAAPFPDAGHRAGVTFFSMLRS